MHLPTLRSDALVGPGMSKAEKEARAAELPVITEPQVRPSNQQELRLRIAG